MTIYYFGEISETRKQQWEQKEDASPNSLFKWQREINTTQNAVIRNVKKFLHDEIQTDWGTRAYKGNKEDFSRFFTAIDLPDEAKSLEKNKIYVFAAVELW